MPSGIRRDLLACRLPGIGLLVDMLYGSCVRPQNKGKYVYNSPVIHSFARSYPQFATLLGKNPSCPLIF